VLVFAVVPVLMMFLVFGTLFESVKQLPGFPTDNYYEYLAAAAVLMTTVPGISNSAIALATDFQNRYLYKLLTTPASTGSIMLGRLLGDGLRLYLQAGGMLLLTMAFGARIETDLRARSSYCYSARSSRSSPSASSRRTSLSRRRTRPPSKRSTQWRGC
jgi:hypothetical protein